MRLRREPLATFAVATSQIPFSLFRPGESSVKPALRARNACLYCAREKHWSGWKKRHENAAADLGFGTVMEKLLLEYLPILIFIGIAGVLGAALIVVPLIVAPSKPDPEKLSAYECGFPAFGDARMKFDVRFYLVAILFIIFDLEVTFLFPWAVVYGQLGVYGFWSMMVFLAVLTVGFIFEWKKGALEWD